MSQQINLFNPIFLKQKKYFSAITMLQALGLLLAGTLVLSVWAAYQARMLRGEAEASAAQLALAKSQLTQLTAQASTRQKSSVLEEEVRAGESELKALQQVFDILRSGDLGNTRGYSEYMAAFARQSVNGVWLTGFALEGAGREIALQGRTLQPELVPAYIAQLAREPVLQGKSFSALEMREATAPGEGERAGRPLGWHEFSLRSQPGGGKEETTDAGRK
ncbi:PilN domain-containing protein [Noviherbaspirillum aridicola]|uniref:MSHA biogenesis protein MshI n=1 Tax=Noviherbaspirillum aridicola TaxID=2849687 RepID=A0ABQ4Q5W3_9BURK|nr:PilN domain-containing protein [Noviherbaspirillum aridicola]GIZ52434.1 hypothetical protein NCCP691_24480 [Noviherbaspirillum aridicola]